MNVNEIESKIAKNEMSAAQVFTQMKQHINSGDDLNNLLDECRVQLGLLPGDDKDINDLLQRIDCFFEALIDEWISVDDRLPNLITAGSGLQTVRKSKPVLIKVSSGAMGVCVLDGDEWSLQSRAVAGEIPMHYDYLVDDVTHWKELPK